MIDGGITSPARSSVTQEVVGNQPRRSEGRGADDRHSLDLMKLWILYQFWEIILSVSKDLPFCGTGGGHFNQHGVYAYERGTESTV